MSDVQNSAAGEGCDAADLRLPGRQEELLEAVLATGTPTVVVLLVGRPYDLSHGLSYAPAQWETVELVRGDRWATDGVCESAVTLHNPAARVTREVVQVYLHDPVAEVVRPVMALIGFARVELGPGERCRARIRVHADLTSFTGRAGERIVEPGDVELRVGRSSADVHARLALRLVGARRVVGYDRRRTPDVIIEPPR